MERRIIPLSILGLIICVCLPAKAAPPPFADTRLHPPIASQVRCLQLIGDGHLWHKNAGLSKVQTEFPTGIEITDSETIAAVIRTIHCSGSMVKYHERVTNGYIGVLMSSKPSPIGDIYKRLTGEYSFSYFKQHGSAFLLDSQNAAGQTMPPVYAARFEAVLKRAARMARHHRDHAKFFRYPEAELAAN